MKPEATSNAMRNRRMFRFIGYTLVFLMMACVVMTLGNLIHGLLPQWHANIIAGILLFLVIDRLYTYRQLKYLTPLSSEWAVALGAQWALIVILIRFLLSYASGVDAFLADLSLFTRGSIMDLFTGEYVITLLLAALAWILPAQFLDLLDEIGLDEQLALHEDTPPIELYAVPAHQRLVNLIFSLGIVLVVLTVLTRINVRSILSNQSGLPDVEVSRFSGAEAGALLYFVCGLTLLSLSRLMSLQTHWNRLRIPVASNTMTRQWGIYSLVFLLFLAVVVSLLPAGDSIGLFSVLGTLIGFLIGVLFFIGQLLLILISLIFSLPLMLLRGEPVTESLPPAPLFPVMPPVEAPMPTESSPAWVVIRSILLWGSLILILVFALVHVVRQHGGIREALRQSRVASWLVLAWQWLSRNAEKTRGTLARALADGWQNIVSRLEGKRILPPVSLLSIRSLDPRQRIYFFYLAMIRRGTEQGFTRKPSQTPAEYAATLERSLPSAEEDIDSITEAFVEARYSRQDVDASRADIVKATWGRIRRALQSKAKNEPGEKK